ncbi:SAM-dependent methyltransferase [Flavitalea sp. BT771]|uniref:SAM-dependent methyltransferase n=1 Tax=Flavitalea sp. BT771 TaxID=3063329 RepID=UPI0026E2634D|nr:SAM-dependent methyltransferase [Flavitalea sp. BT771]MDO6433016.1 SAM-dependent methyltransferase [Flavitalea sp. BT771]MDV6221708.1 SAM-dependent methyltransferase [Flavitalea sp. BT771]
MNGSIIVAGSGITLGQMTMETQNYIKTADVVYYVLTDIVTESWVTENARIAHSMKEYYEEGVGRIHTYIKMANTVLDAARQGHNVCALFYGHPGIFVTPSHEIVRIARAEGIPARMLAGVSAEDCLVADFGFDPGKTGCAAYEATQLLAYPKKLDTAAWLIIWQPEATGDVAYTKNRQYAQKVQILRDYLLKFYLPDTKAAVYEANTYSIGAPKIEWKMIKDLCDFELSGISTLVIPPATKAEMDLENVYALGIPEVVSNRHTSDYSTESEAAEWNTP